MTAAAGNTEYHVAVVGGGAAGLHGRDDMAGCHRTS